VTNWENQNGYLGLNLSKFEIRDIVAFLDQYAFYIIYLAYRYPVQNFFRKELTHLSFAIVREVEEGG
jgi:hypothetical protein